MHNRAFFWKPFRSERGNGSQKLLKIAEKYFDSSFYLFWAKLSYKKLFLIRSDISGLLVNMLTANYKYSRSKKRIYRYKFKSNDLKNNKPFAESYLSFHNLHEMSNGLKQKSASYIKYLGSYWVRKMCLFNWITGLVSENPWLVNVLKSPKKSWKLEKSTFILRFLHSEPNWIRKSYI